MVGGQQVLDLAGQPHLPAGDQDEIAGQPLQLGQYVRGQQHRHAVGGRRRQHRGHEVVPGDRVEHRHRLVQHQQPLAPGQRQGQRDLCLLPAGQLPAFRFSGLPSSASRASANRWSKRRVRLRVRCSMSATDRVL